MTSRHTEHGVELLPVEDACTRDAARSLIAEYLRWIASSAATSYGLSFDVDAMVTSDLEDRVKFYPPDGRFYVIRHSNTYIGGGCLKRLTPTVAEVQRMYVQPHARGIGAGRRLIGRLLTDARAIGYEAVRLESLKLLSVAHALYRSIGFEEITPYAESSMNARSKKPGAPASRAKPRILCDAGSPRRVQPARRQYVCFGRKYSVRSMERTVMSLTSTPCSTLSGISSPALPRLHTFL